MKTDIERDIAGLAKMTVGQLREKYAEVFGETSRTRHKQHLVRKIAWRLQALADGDLSERARRRAEELARDADVRVTAPRDIASTQMRMSAPRRVVPVATDLDPRLPAPGTVIVREYKGGRLEVMVLPNGFEYDGRRFNSLTAVAKEISGSHCNGFRFFGLEVNQ